MHGASLRVMIMSRHTKYTIVHPKTWAVTTTDWETFQHLHITQQITVLSMSPRSRRYDGEWIIKNQKT